MIADAYFKTTLFKGLIEFQHQIQQEWLNDLILYLARMMMIADLKLMKKGHDMLPLSRKFYKRVIELDYIFKDKLA